uniref:Family with sequence similarity 83 member D n=1 Tax=Eptatretus burgeri TaxID=7764 RepID=A0A8C4QBP0_EPTBU
MGRASVASDRGSAPRKGMVRFLQPMSGGRAPHACPKQYSELQRLAVESLVHSGFEGYREFVRKEHVREFLSDTEKSAILSRVRRADDDRETRRSRRDSALPASTYFPEQSDIEPPMLDLGWPDLKDVYRGVSRVDVCFEPFMGAGLGSCRQEIRKLVRSAKSVVAVAMDVFTDPDIFKDMLDASISRRVPVYLVLDERSSGVFVLAHYACNVAQSCVSQNMRIRTVPGLTYCTRSGMKILGCVQEKYMLVDCNKVATGTYSYTWSDAKLHRSSITLLSGSVTEAYDKAFCILYAHSQPFSIDCSATIQQCTVPASPKHILPSQEPSKLEHTADNGKSAPLCYGCTGLKKLDHCVVEIGTQTDSCPTSHKETGKMMGMPSRRSGTRRSSIALKQQQQPVDFSSTGILVACVCFFVSLFTSATGGEGGCFHPLSVCLLVAKAKICQVYWSVDFCCSVCLSVCLSVFVCLFVLLSPTGHNFKPIFTKLHHMLEFIIRKKPFVFEVKRSTT